MEEDQLLLLAQNSLKTPNGIKLLGEEINILEISAQINSLSTRYNINLSEIGTSSTKELNLANVESNKSTTNLTAREKIQAKNNIKTNSEKSKIEAIKSQINQLKLKLKSQKPTLETYKISGRIFDQTNGDVLTGVKVQLGVNPERESTLPSIGLPISSELISTKIDLDFQDQVFNVASPKSTTTDSQGNFTLEVKVPIIPQNQKSILNIGLLYSKSGFIPGNVPIINGDRTIKTNLQAFSLINTSKASEIISQEYKNKIDQAQSLVNSLALDPIEQIISARKLSIGKLVDTIKSKLLPLVIGMLIQFGISKLSQSNRKTCPTPQSLDNIIKNRNRTVRQLNQIYLTIITNTALATAFLALAGTLKGVRLSLDSLPFPQATGTPPLKDFGGLIFAQPYSVTAKLQHLNDELEKLEIQNKNLNKSQLTSLVFLIAGTVTVVLLLKGIDKLVQECAEENGTSNAELILINQDLLNLSDEQIEDGNPVISNINGFILSVTTDNKNPVGTLKRRFAIAKNSQGVTLLKGEQSFSSSDQILIDELVFYIQQNNLKAY